jgi:hypothetical protein
MPVNLPADITELQAQLEANERDAQALVAGLTDEQGSQAPEGGGWSVAECLDHLATGNRVYLHAMQEPANRARMRGKLRSRPAKPGWVGRLFADLLEPPPRWWFKLKAPRKIRPRAAPLAQTFADFMDSQALMLEFLHANADLDLAGIRFPNPFVKGIFFSLATGLHVTAAHERRHLWQAWRVRREIERDKR